MTAEQKAREMLERMEMARPRRFGLDPVPPSDMSSGELVELANLIAERDELESLFARYVEHVYSCSGRNGDMLLGDEPNDMLPTFTDAEVARIRGMKP